MKIQKNIRIVGALLFSVMCGSVLVSSNTTTIPEEKKLEGMVVVIDQGHGGLDKGANLWKNGRHLCEDEYVYDVATRLGELARREGAEVLYTIKDSSQSIVNSAEFISPDQNESFVVDNSVVESGWRNLDKRIMQGRNALSLYPKHRVIFLSLHIDSGDSNIKGSYVIVPQGHRNLEIARCILEAFRQHEMLRSKGGEEFYIMAENIRYGRKLRLLRTDKNPVHQKVLVELANIRNAEDQVSIVSPIWREKCATTLLEALVQVNSTTEVQLCR